MRRSSCTWRARSLRHACWRPQVGWQKHARGLIKKGVIVYIAPKTQIQHVLFIRARVFLPTQGREHRPGFQVHIVQVSAQCAGVLRTSCGAPPCQGEQGQQAGRADRRTGRASTTTHGKNTRKEEPPQESQQGEEQEPCLPDHGVNGIRYWHSLRDTPNVVTFTCEKLIALL